jgi:hypothetical protein
MADAEAPDTTSVSYFRDHIAKDDSNALEGPELHADLAVESARAGLVNFMSDCMKQLPPERRRSTRDINSYAATAITLEALRQFRKMHPQGYASLLYDLSEMEKERMLRRKAEKSAARWQMWCLIFAQMAGSAVVIALIVALA